MIQSLSKKSPEEIQERFQQIKLLIVDEAHHAQADTYIDLLKKIPAIYRYGFTATPKEPKEDLGGYLKVTGILGPIIHRVSVNEAKARIIQPYLKMFSYDDPREALQQVQDWQVAYQEGIINNVYRNQKIANIVRYYLKRSRHILVTIKNIKHGELLQEMLGIPFVQGKDDTKTRQEIKRALQFSSHAVISTNIFGEGVDIPALDVLINAGGGLSKIAVIQQAGRVLRRASDKDSGLIVDFWDRNNFHLRRHSKARYKQYKEVLAAVEI